MTTNVLTHSFNPAILDVVLLVVRVYLGGMIFTHGYQKAFRGARLAGTAAWFDSIGMRPAKLNAFMAAYTEMLVGVCLVVGFLTPLAAAGLISLMIVAAVVAHLKNGFLLTNHGYEYTATVAVMALVPGAFGAGRYSLDDATHVLSHWTHTLAFAVTVVVGVVAGLAQLAACYRPGTAAR